MRRDAGFGDYPWVMGKRELDTDHMINWEPGGTRTLAEACRAEAATPFSTHSM